MIELPDVDVARAQWTQAAPFPHVVIPHALTRDDAAQIGAEFPPPDRGWHTFTGPLEAGKQEGNAQIAGPLVAALHDELAAERFVGWLRTVAAIPDLLADPYRHGGGIHQSGPGARLGIHTDFALNPMDETMVRAVNVIVFVGDHDCWPAEWGGVLELGADRDVAVLPLAGLLVAFETSDTSWHGHPIPMSADAPLRKSVPAYLYRPMGPDEQIEQHSTKFLVIERGER